jgi:molybdopterin-binding protein
MKLSTRNRLPGTVTEVVKGEAAAKVTLQVGDNHVVALITRESADELGLEPGKQVTALVKATGVGAVRPYASTNRGFRVWS